MIYVVLPLGVLILAITVVRLMRNIRQIGELRARRIPMAMPLSRPTPSETFHEQIWLPLCSQVAAAAQAKLNRPLTPTEKRTIWRSRAVRARE